MLKLPQYFSGDQGKKRKRYIILLFFALLIGFLYALFHLLMIQKLGDLGQKYYWVTPNTQGDFIFHIWPAIREAFDGHFPRGDVDLLEYKNIFFTPLPQLTPIFFLPFLLLFRSMEMIWVAEPVFYAIIFLLFYYLFFILTERRKIAIFFAFLYTLIRTLPYLLLPTSFAELKNIIKIFLPISLDGNPPFRVDIPLMESYFPGLLILLPLNIFLLLFLKNSKRRFLYLAGIFYGLLFYTYTFYWLNTTLALGLFIILAFFSQTKLLIRDLIKILMVGWLVSLPYWINYLSLKTLPHWADVANRLSGQQYNFSHDFIFSWWPTYIWYIILILLLWMWGKKTTSLSYAQFFISIIAANFIFSNIQVITGFNLAMNHWQSRTITVAMAATQVVLLNYLWSKFKHKSILFKNTLLVIGGLIILLEVSGAITTQMARSNKSFYQHFHQIDPTIMAGLNWLDANTPKDAVVMTPSLYMNHLLLIYTNKNIFIPRGVSALASNAEITERLYLTYKLYSVDQQSFEKLFTPNNEIKIISKQAQFNEFAYRQNKEKLESYDTLEMQREYYLFGAYYYGQRSGENRKFMLDSERAKFYSDYANFRVNLRQPNSLYHFDYLLSGPMEQNIANPNFSKYDFLVKVYDQAGFKIYKIINNYAPR